MQSETANFAPSDATWSSWPNIKLWMWCLLTSEQWHR